MVTILHLPLRHYLYASTKKGKHCVSERTALYLTIVILVTMRVYPTPVDLNILGRPTLMRCRQESHTFDYGEFEQMDSYKYVALWSQL